MGQHEKCLTHGNYEKRVVHVLGSEFTQPCPKCTDEKMAKDREIKAANLEREVRHLLKMRLKYAAIPPRFTFDLGDFEKAKREKALFWLGQQNGQNLLVYGSVGTMKTSFACALLKKACESTTGTYTTARDMNLEISQERTSSKFVDCGLLVIDEFNRAFKTPDGRPTQASLDQMFDVIDKRSAFLLPTVIVANIEKTSVGEYLGEAVYDRLGGDGMPSIVFKGESKR